MKFLITRTCDSGREQPVPAAKFEKKIKMKLMYGTQNLWSIEVDSIETLIALIRACDYPIIVNTTDEPEAKKISLFTLEVYDDYRE